MPAINKILSSYDIRDHENFISYTLNESKEVVSLELFDSDYEDFPGQVDIIEFVSNFKNLKHLSIEDLVHRKIDDLSLLESLTELESIHIKCDTTITNLDFTSNLDHLISLEIISSELSDINCLSKNKKLNFIGLTNANIEDISVLAELSHIKFLDFSKNQISEINALKDHVGIKSLSLVANSINNIQALDGFEALTHFNISHNSIRDLKPISKSNGLRSFCIANNEIADVHFLNECHDLASLDISNNLINNIDFLKEKNKLNYVNISNNPINCIDSLTTLPDLKVLNASFLKNLEMEHSFNFKSELTHLKMDNCNLLDASFLSKQQKLNSLNLSNNQLSNFEFLQNKPFLKNLNLKDNGIKDVFPAYYFFDINGIDLRGNEFGGKIFERYSGSAVNLNFQFYNYNLQTPPDRSVMDELNQQIADHYYEIGEYDAALAYYYLNNSSQSETVFNIFLQKFLDTPDTEVEYLQYYFSSIFRNVPSISKYKGRINPTTKKRYADFLEKFNNLYFPYYRLPEGLKKPNVFPTSQHFFKFNNYAFHVYEKKAKNPLILDEFLYLKAHNYRNDNTLKREDLNAAMLGLKELHNRNSPYFFTLKKEILTTLRNQFAYTVPERKLHDYFWDGVINIHEREFKESKPVNVSKARTKDTPQPSAMEKANNMLDPKSPLISRRLLQRIAWWFFVLLMILLAIDRL